MSRRATIKKVAPVEVALSSAQRMENMLKKYKIAFKNWDQFVQDLLDVGWIPPQQLPEIADETEETTEVDNASTTDSHPGTSKRSSEKSSRVEAPSKKTKIQIQSEARTRTNTRSSFRLASKEHSHSLEDAARMTLNTEAAPAKKSVRKIRVEDVQPEPVVEPEPEPEVARSSRKKNSEVNSSRVKASKPAVGAQSSESSSGNAESGSQLLHVEQELQECLDTLSHKLLKKKDQFRFEIDDGVLCLAHGYYYECEARSDRVISRGPAMAVPTWSEEEQEVSPYPVYSVTFRGWSKRYNALAPENTLIGRKSGVPSYENAFGMLFAHYFNQFHIMAFGPKSKARKPGRGFWILSDEDRALVEKTWQEGKRTKQSFADYCQITH